MGPDCGTAVVGGVGLGFANVVGPARSALVAASGTGAQQVMCLLDAAGVGVSHCLGVGGRDLSAAGRRALHACGARPAGRRPGDRADRGGLQAARRRRWPTSVRARARTLGTPVDFALLGPGSPTSPTPPRRAVRARRRPPWLSRGRGRLADVASARAGALRGLFCRRHPLRRGHGDSRRERSARSGPTSRSTRAGALADDLRSDGHLHDRLRRRPAHPGPAHPMIDPSLRAGRASQRGCRPGLRRAAARRRARPRCAPRPGGRARPRRSGGPAAAAAAGRELAVVVSLVGTADDPQGLDRQAEALRRRARRFTCPTPPPPAYAVDAGRRRP